MNVWYSGANDEADPRFQGGSKVSSGYDGDPADANEEHNANANANEGERVARV